MIAEEELPGADLDSDAELRTLRPRPRLGPSRLLQLRDRPRATRAACSTATCASTACTGLRVVDASVFPRIPGFFIASAVYMVGEKAADVILAHNAAREAA